MKRGWTLALMALGALLALILCAPLRWFVPDGLVSARQVTGSIWSGRIEDVSVGPVRLGTLTTRLRWPGRLEVSAQTGGADALQFALSPGSTLHLNDAEGRLPLDIRLGPVTSDAIDLRTVSLAMDGGGCDSAKGRVVATARLSNAAFLPPLALSGTLECVGRDLATVMKSQSGLEQIEFRLYPNRNWQARILIRPASPELADLLRANGFSESPLGYVRVEQGIMGG